jgi:segregation and condensation protein A
MSYRVKAGDFEGPFQLLLRLVSQQKVDVGAISIAQIADQYLAYIDDLGALDMDVASDFLLVASTLLSLKAQALLPDERATYGDELDDLDPADAREILIARLIAYKQFKNAAAALNSRMEAEGRMHPRQAGLEPQFLNLLPDYLAGVTLHNLAVICADLATRREVFLLEAEHVAAKPIPVESKVDEFATRLERHPHQTFKQLIDDTHDPVLFVVGFLAVLELYHRGMVDLEQAEQYGEIEIHYRDRADWAPAEPIEPETSAVDEYLETLEQPVSEDA